MQSTSFDLPSDVGPEVVVCSEESNRKFSSLVRCTHQRIRNVPWVTDFSWPPPGQQIKSIKSYPDSSNLPLPIFSTETQQPLTAPTVSFPLWSSSNQTFSWTTPTQKPPVNKPCFLSLATALIQTQQAQFMSDQLFCLLYLFIYCTCNKFSKSGSEAKIKQGQSLQKPLCKLTPTIVRLHTHFTNEQITILHEYLYCSTQIPTNWLSSWADKPIVAEFCPNDFTIERSFSFSALLTLPTANRWSHYLQTIQVKSSRAALTAQQSTTWSKEHKKKR